VIDRGVLIWDGGISDLKERYGGERTLVVDLEEPGPPLAIEGATVERVEGPRQWLRFRGSASELTARVVDQARIVDLQLQEPDIEEIVRRIYSRGPQELSSP
jgi:ABC-2 type transport system ATP-binding protein